MKLSGFHYRDFAQKSVKSDIKMFENEWARVERAKVYLFPYVIVNFEYNGLKIH